MFINFTNGKMLRRVFVTEFISMIGLRNVWKYVFFQTVADTNYKKI